MNPKVAIIIPCYKVTAHVLELLQGIPEWVADAVYVVDDKCPQQSGKLVREKCSDPRVKVLFNEKNMGVGGAVKAGFEQASRDGFDILVKIDGDGQMAPLDIPKLVQVIRDGKADYAKANRFFSPRALKGMPGLRVFGNAALSFLTKLSSGYWGIMDPTNGFIAIHSRVFHMLEPEKIENRFFFETDMLFRLHLIGATVIDVPIPARYGDQESNLKIGHTFVSFSQKHVSRFFRRIVYDYFVRDFNVGSVEIVSGLLLFTFGVLFGSYHLIAGFVSGVPTEVGTIMIASLTTILGFQLLLAALNFDVSRRPQVVLHTLLRNGNLRGVSEENRVREVA